MDVKISSSAEDLLKADRAILPGVGAFPDAIENLERLGLVDAIREFVAIRKPLMGVCLGMQLLFTSSEEFGHSKGLDLVKGCIRKLPNQEVGGLHYKVPHIGWAQLQLTERGYASDSPLRSISERSYMYFVHSFYAEAQQESAAAFTHYGNHVFCSAIRQDNLFAVQFHPEKSGELGLAIYRDWSSFKTTC